ncbi:MAG: hypothetical protein ACKVKM_04875, partial [Verrucomicrobiia bacterium]
LNEKIWVNHENGPGSTPVLWKDLLIFHMDGSDQQFVVALDKKTGHEKWRTPRSGKMHANPQLKKSYGTPLIQEINGKPTLFSPGAKAGHRPRHDFYEHWIHESQDFGRAL